MRAGLGVMAAILTALPAAAAESTPWARLVGETQVVFAGSGTAAAGPDVPAHTYRIPALALTRAGTLLAFAEARRQGAGDSGDIDIVVRRSTDRGRTWSAETIVADDAANVTGNPCPVVLASGRILLLSTWNAGSIPESRIAAGFGADSRRVFVRSSDDDGLTWSAAREITADVKRPEWTWYATGPGSGLQLKTGRVVIPCDHRSAEGDFSHLITSDDDGATWRIGAISPPGLNESMAVELADGSVMLNCRTAPHRDRPSPRRRGVCISHDGGDSFDEAAFRHDDALVEPVCQAAIRRWSWPTDGAAGLILFSNPASETRRIALTLRGSHDDGRTWPLELLVHPGGSAYSDLAVLPDGTVLVLFERDGYRTIGLATIAIERDDAP
jgi:sialidase-1